MILKPLALFAAALCASILLPCTARAVPPSAPVIHSPENGYRTGYGYAEVSLEWDQSFFIACDVNGQPFFRFSTVGFPLPQPYPITIGLPTVGVNHITFYSIDETTLEESQRADLTIERVEGTDTDLDGVPDFNDSCPLFSNPMQIGQCLAPPRVRRGATLDYDNDGVSNFTKLSAFRRTNLFERPVGEFGQAITLGNRSSKPITGDFNGDGTSDFGVIDVQAGGAKWTAQLNDRIRREEIFGALGDTFLSGCNFNLEPATDIAYLRDRVLYAKKMKKKGVTTIPLLRYRSIELLSCIDLNGDGIDEVVIKASRGRGTPRRIVVVNRAGTEVVSMPSEGVLQAFAADWEGDGGFELALHSQNTDGSERLSFYDQNTLDRIGFHDFPATIQLMQVRERVVYPVNAILSAFTWLREEGGDFVFWSPSVVQFDSFNRTTLQDESHSRVMPAVSVYSTKR